MLICENCRFENLPTATFCMNCGHALARPQTLTLAQTTAPRQAERRFVTILFADLSGFTALSEMRDPEDVRQVINACFDRLVPIVETRQGVVDQFVGDALVALFGAPVAHEDDPAQACRAALEMLHAIESINAERNLNLGLHLGINSGIVLAGGVGSRGRQQYSVLGDAVNVASRLQDAAERGEIFVGADTYKLTRDQFEFVSRGAMPFKGKNEPQPVWQLTAVKTDAPARRRVLTHTPMLGRERELTMLTRATGDVLTQEPGLRLVSILGDAGLGKSRLVQEWLAAMPGNAKAPAHFICAACAPDSATRAYALLTALARALSSPAPNFTPPAALVTLLGAPTSAQNFEAVDNLALQAQYAAGLRELVSQHTTNAALVLVCEDLHWADAPSVQVLQGALSQLVNARVLIVFTSRLESETPGWELIQYLQELPGVAAMRLHLTPLGEQDARALVAALVPGALPPALEPLVLRHAEGNPLFVQELVCMLLDRGDLYCENDQWVLTRELRGTTAPALDVPTTLQGVLMARVDQLPPDARHILQIASILGRESPLEVLEHMLERTS